VQPAEEKRGREWTAGWAAGVIRPSGLAEGEGGEEEQAGPTGQKLGKGKRGSRNSFF
jgi:hypothetical protein